MRSGDNLGIFMIFFCNMIYISDIYFLDRDSSRLELALEFATSFALVTSSNHS